MHREPSIHITQTNLEKILSRKKVSGNIKELVNEILMESRKYSLSHRSLLATNQKARQKAHKVASSSLEDAMLVAQTLYQVRRQLRHRAIEVIKPNSRDWVFMKTLAENMNEYLEVYDSNATKKTSYGTYLKTALSKLNKYSLPGLQGIHPRMMQESEALLELNKNEYPEKTEQAYKEYNRHIMQTVGSILTDYSKLPQEYKYFMDVAYICADLKISPKVYIDAQFEGLKWAKGIPQPSQLATDKAKERLQTYLFENDIRIKEDVGSEEKVNKLKGLRKLKDDNN